MSLPLGFMRVLESVRRISKWADRRCGIRGRVSSAALLRPLATSQANVAPAVPSVKDASCFLVENPKECTRARD